jgi:hypothetical protein
MRPMQGATIQFSTAAHDFDVDRFLHTAAVLAFPSRDDRI